MSVHAEAHVPLGTVVKGGEPKLTIRILRRCNFNCPLCATFSGTDHDGLMAMAGVDAIAATLAAENFRGVINISGGEPTLHPELDRILRRLVCGVPGARIVVFTNGSWIGRPGWDEQLRRMFALRTVLVRFSLDHQHVVGASRASGRAEEETRRDAFSRAQQFLGVCRDSVAVAGLQYDFAFKGSEAEARAYLSELGPVPLYLIRFQKDPVNRTREDGFFAVDIDCRGTPSVYLTLGHFSARESMGGLEALSAALAINRARMGSGQ